MARRTVAQGAVIAAAVAVLTTGCLQQPGQSATGGGRGGSTGSGDNNIEIMYGFSGPQSQAFQDAMKEFSQREGINIKFSPTPDFDKLVRSRVAGNNLPDLAIFPQPGITLDIARSGKLADLRTVLDADALDNLVLLDAAQAEDGKVYAAPMSVSVKSLVWYPKQEFEKAGYTVPKSQAELLALTDKIRASGTTPWCVGIESAAATGWPATDWFEDYVLRIGGPEKYDQWTKHQIPFNDPVVKQAGEAISKIWFTEGNVLGGRRAITSTNFGTAANPMFENPPKCFLHRQASFLAQPGSVPTEIVKNLDQRAAVFPLPPMEEGEGQPIMGGGDLAGLFSQGDSASEAAMRFMTSKSFGNLLAPQGGFISPRKDFDISKYPNQTMKDIAEIAYSATAYKFDGSDVMPGEVGSGSFWRNMVAWSNGQKKLDQALSDIESSWPQQQ